MPRRKPASGKQRKEQLQIKRAIKRGDTSLGAQANSRQGSRSSAITTRDVSPRRYNQSARANNNASRRLESSFVKVSPGFLEETKRKASTLIIERPIPTEKLLCPPLAEQNDSTRSAYSNQPLELTLPRRPKWRYDMSKKEVENNEAAYFKRWLDETDRIIQTWKDYALCVPSISTCLGQPSEQRLLDIETRIGSSGLETMPYAPPRFERNLEVWRQMWRVVEICQVLLVLLDSRCPLLHYPPSLHAYLMSFRPLRKVIFVLTKVDIVGYKKASFWKAYLQRTYPAIRVVTVESYLENASDENQRKRVIRAPCIPADLRKDLVQALNEVHDELCSPPQHIASDASKLAKWKPAVVSSIDWHSVLNAKEEDITSDHPISAHDADSEDSNNGVGNVDTFLSVGLIGQPNVGKSSLLNALFGSHRVKASKTPGKTKHFQTLFWSKQVRLVDCPGLVFPAFVDLEMQVLAGILPISQIPAIPSSIHYALQYLPLENILVLQHPTGKIDKVKDKRTWRPGMQPTRSDNHGKSWTAIDVLTAFAEKHGWITAKAGRPDVNRAGNYMLRMLAEGRIKWAFYPPDMDMCVLATEDRGLGIWIQGEAGEYTADGINSDYAADSDDPVTDAEDHEGTSELEEHDESSDTQLQSVITSETGMFNALSLEDGDDK